MDSSSTSSSAPLTQAELDKQLLRAALNGCTDTVLDLITAGANVNATDPSGNTALIDAAGNDDTATVSVLIANGANLNLANQFGFTALMSAISFGNTAAVSLLIANGANVTAGTQHGDNPLRVATRNGGNEMTFRLFNAMSPQEISSTRPTPSFLNRLLRRQPAISPIEASYNQALTELRQGLSNVFGAFNEGANRHNLGTANALMNIITSYYAPSWCGNPNQEMSHALTERRRPVILSSTARAMNLLRSTLTSLTNAVTPANEDPAAEQGSNKKARRE